MSDFFILFIECDNNLTEEDIANFAKSTEGWTPFDIECFFNKVDRSQNWQNFLEAKYYKMVTNYIKCVCHHNQSHYRQVPQVYKKS